MRLIDADALLEMYADIPNPVIGTRKVSIYVVRQDILNAPTIDPSSLRKDGIILTENELREKLNDAYDLGYQSCLNYKGLTWKEAEELQRYRENPASLRPKGEWISVNDRLPEYKYFDVLARSDEVLVYTGYGGFAIATLTADEEGYEYWMAEDGLVDVTYWMSLPELPNCGADMRKEATPNV